MNLPEGWKITTLGEVSEFINGDRGKNYPNQKDFITTGIPFINAGHIQNGNINFDSMNYISDQKFNCLGSGKVQHNDILYCLRGSLGKNAIVNDIKKGAIASSLVIIRPHKNISTKYLYYFLNSPLGKTEIYKYDNGSSQPNLSAKSVKSYKIPLPPIASQRRIADILDKADEIIRKRKEAIALTEQLQKSIFLDMFGDPVINPKGWEVKRLEDVTTKITDGVHAKPEYTATGIPFISVKDITTGELVFDNCKFISEESHFKYTRRHKPEYGDILYTKVGATYGRPALVNVRKEFSIYVSVALLKPNREIIKSEFLKEVMATSAVKSQADKSIKGIGVPDLHLNMIKNFLIPVPTISIQDEFIKKAKKINQQKIQLELHLQESENLFNSLLQKAFKGEL